MYHWEGGKKGTYPSRGLGFDIHYRFICMMDATQCVSRMQRQQGQSCLRTKVSLLPVASRRNNDRECPRTAGTAPNTIPYVLPSTSSFYSLGPLSRERERERLLSSLFYPPSLCFHSAPRPLFLYRVFFPTTILRVPFCRYAFLFRRFLLLLVSSSCNENSRCFLRFLDFSHVVRVVSRAF